MIESSCQLYNPVDFGSIPQGQVEILSAEREVQQKAGVTAEKAHSELNQTARRAEVCFTVLIMFPLGPTPTLHRTHWRYGYRKKAVLLTMTFCVFLYFSPPGKSTGSGSQAVDWARAKRSINLSDGTTEKGHCATWVSFYVQSIITCVDIK